MARTNVIAGGTIISVIILAQVLSPVFSAKPSYSELTSFARQKRPADTPSRFKSLDRILNRLDANSQPITTKVCV